MFDYQDQYGMVADCIYADSTENNWRGAVWLDQAYFGVKALERYGFQDEADEFTGYLFDRLEGLKNSDMPKQMIHDR